MKTLVEKAKKTQQMLHQDVDKLAHYQKNDLVLELQKKLTFLADTGLQIARIAEEISEEEKEFAHMLSMLTADMFLQITDTIRTLSTKNIEKELVHSERKDSMSKNS